MNMDFAGLLKIMRAPAARWTLMAHRSSPLVVVLLLSIGVSHGRAAPADDPVSFVERLVHRGLRTVSDAQLSAIAREERFASILDSDFDFPRIARFVTGHYWTSAAVPDREHFVDTFKRWVIHTYSSRFSGYSGESVKITGSRAESQTMFTVASQIVRTGGSLPSKIDWRVRRDNGDDYRIVDVAVEGVSMLLTQREEFASIIERSGGTLSGVTRALEEKISKGDTNAAPIPFDELAPLYGSFDALVTVAFRSAPGPACRSQR